MAERGDENIGRPEGAEGGHSSSSDEIEYELMAEEEVIDTTWEAGEVHPKPEYPARVGFGGTGLHPSVPPPRVYLTDETTRSSPSVGVQTEPQQEQSEEQRPQQQEQGGQEDSTRAPRSPSFIQRMSTRWRDKWRKSPDEPRRKPK